MYAVVQLGSDQFKVKEGDIISPKKIDKEEGSELTLDKVLMFVKDSDVRIGTPYVEGVEVMAKVVKQILDEKVVAYKYRRTKDSASKKGHRQKLTSLSITKISG